MKTFRADGQPSRDDECEHGLRRFEKCPHCLADEIERLREALRIIADTPAWGYPDKWEDTPTELRHFARAALGEKE